jgi:hypothetical protein
MDGKSAAEIMDDNNAYFTCPSNLLLLQCAGS